MDQIKSVLKTSLAKVSTQHSFGTQIVDVGGESAFFFYSFYFSMFFSHFFSFLLSLVTPPIFVAVAPFGAYRLFALLLGEIPKWYSPLKKKLERESGGGGTVI